MREFPSPCGSVVVVDDDPGVRAALQFLLETDGQRVRTFPSAASFLRQGLSRDIACLVLDQSMPGLSGLELLQEIRRRGIEAPAILIMGTPNAGVRHRALAAGASVVMEKPLADDVFLPAIRNCLSRASGGACPMTPPKS